MKKTIELTAEKLQDIYTDEQFRNNVAFAHWQCDGRGNKLHRKTCSYPVEYIVNDEQVKAAETERQRAIKQAVKDSKGKLVFVGMGSTYAPRYADDVCNHRIRTEIVNAEGKSFFVEFGTGRGEEVRIDHAVNRDLEREYNRKASELWDERNKYKAHSKEWNELTEEIHKYMQQPYHNYKGLERLQDRPKYTKANILELVNSYFDCHFTEVVIDNYNLSTDDYKSISPKK